MVDKVTFAPVSTFTNDTTAVTQTNANYVLMQNAIDNTVSRDGTTPNQMNASLDMNHNRILNLASPGTPNEPLRLADVSIVPLSGLVYGSPSNKVGLTAVNGVSTSVARADSAPALDVTISPTWTGTHTFTNTPVFSGGFTAPLTISGTATNGINFTGTFTNLLNSTNAIITSNGTVQLGPVANNRGISIGNTLTGTSAVEFDANAIVVQSGQNMSTAGDSCVGLSVNTQLAAGANGTFTAVKAETDLLVTGINRAVGDMIGLQANAFSNVNAGGTNTGAGAVGTLFGISALGDLGTGGTNWEIVTGGEVQGIIASGASAQIRAAWTLASNGQVQGAVQDAGLLFYSYTTTPFQFGIQFSDVVGGFAPISSSGTIMGTDGHAHTVANGIDFSAWTFTGNLLNFPSFTVNKFGVISMPSAMQPNSTVATALTSVGPTGSHTTVQEWLAIVGSGGATRYIPCF